MNVENRDSLINKSFLVMIPDFKFYPVVIIIAKILQQPYGGTAIQSKTFMDKRKYTYHLMVDRDFD